MRRIVAVLVVALAVGACENNVDITWPDGAGPDTGSVTDTVTRVHITPKKDIVGVKGDTARVSCTVTGRTQNKDCRFLSTEVKVALVDNRTGLIKLLNPGTTDICAYLFVDPKVDDCITVTVKSP